MTVEELVEKLSYMNPRAEVVFCYTNYLSCDDSVGEQVEQEVNYVKEAEGLVKLS